MKKIENIHTLLTHVNPDLDAILSLYFLKYFGSDYIGGVEKATLAFASAGKLPGDKTAEQLEKAGILCVDIGGGRFDNHPTKYKSNSGKIDLAAVELAARFLKLKSNPEWKEIIEYARLQDTKGHHLFSTDPNHMMISLISILGGIRLCHPGDDLKKVMLGHRLISCLPFYVSHRNRKDIFQDTILPLIEQYLKRRGLDRKQLPNYLSNFSDWLSLLENNAPETFSRNKVDDLVSLKSILVGATFNQDLTPEDRLEIIDTCMDAIIRREESWHAALTICKEIGKQIKFNRISAFIIKSENGMTIKAGRYLYQPDIVLYVHPIRHFVSVLWSKRGQLPANFNQKLAAKIRIAESVLRNHKIIYDDLEKAGKIQDWFLHQSKVMLLRGSPKSTDFEPTKIPFPLLIKILELELAIFSGDPTEEISKQIPEAISVEIMKYKLRFMLR